LAALLEMGREALRRSHRPGVARFLHAGLLAFVIASFTWTNWYIARQWVEAWRIEQDIVAKASAWIRKIPSAKAIILKAPRQFNGSEVFSESWAFNAALHISTGRKDIRGIVVKDTMATDARGLVDFAHDPPEIVPYDGLFIYDYDSDSLKRAVPAH
jgi:hypothetical protein